MSEAQAARGASVERVSVPRLDMEAAMRASTDVVLMPRARTDDGRGIYGEATIFLVKELRAEGIEASFLDPSEGRLFDVKKSAIATALVTVVLGVVSSAAWEAVRSLLIREHPEDSPMEITYTDLSPTGTGSSWTVRGEGKDVLEAIDKLIEGREDTEGP